MMNQLSLIDSSRELDFIYAINFVINLYLILIIGVQTSDMTGLKFSHLDPNRPSLYLSGDFFRNTAV
jgi:hypothetical protein